MTAIVGRNDVGKSAIMDALAVFFDEGKPERGDGSVAGDATCVEVECEFTDFPRQIVIDEDFPTTLTSEHLLNRAGRLAIVKRYNCAITTPKLTGVFARALHPTTDRYNDLLLLKRAELHARARELEVDLAGVNRAANAPVRAAIWANAGELDYAETLVPLEKEDAKQIWSRLEWYLPVFALFKSDRASTDQDAEAQDPLRAAVRDAIREREPELRAIQEHVRPKFEMPRRRFSNSEK